MAVWHDEKLYQEVGRDIGNYVILDIEDMGPYHMSSGAWVPPFPAISSLVHHFLAETAWH